MKLCEQCGVAEIPDASKRNPKKYCAACAAERKRESRRRRWRRERLARAAEPHPRFTNRRRRTCLSCGKEFMSWGPGNRRCKHCQEDPFWLKASIMQTKRLWLPAGETPPDE